jgi:hypothetical protein
VAAPRQRLRVEVGLTSQLRDARGDQVGVVCFLVGVFEKLVGGRLCVDASGGKIVTLVTQDAHQFGGQGLVQHVENPFEVSAVGVGYGPLFHVLPRTRTQSLHVSQKFLHGSTFSSPDPLTF